MRRQHELVMAIAHSLQIGDEEHEVAIGRRRHDRGRPSHDMVPAEDDAVLMGKAQMVHRVAGRVQDVHAQVPVGEGVPMHHQQRR